MEQLVEIEKGDKRELRKAVSHSVLNCQQSIHQRCQLIHYIFGDQFGFVRF